MKRFRWFPGSNKASWSMFVWTAVLAVGLGFFCVQPATAEETANELESQLRLTPDYKQYNYEQEITAIAMTEKKGDLVQVEMSIDNYGEKGERLDIPVKTEEVDGQYVSKGVFSTGSRITSYKLVYKIVMDDGEQKWFGHASKMIQVDNMPPMNPSVESIFKIEQKEYYKVGEPIKFTVYTPNKGKLVSEPKFMFFFNSVDQSQPVEELETELDPKNNQYVTTGTFTPKIPGVYKPFFFAGMEDEETGETIEASAVTEFTVEDHDKILVSLSPGTATMKAGDEIYLVAYYKIGKWEDHKISWNYKAEEITRQYDKKRGIQKVVIRFVPKRKGTFTFEVKVEQEDGEKRGAASAVIRVTE